MFLVHRWWQIPYYWFGIKMYDIVAGTKTLKSSYFLSKKNALELFPMLQGDKLCGAIVYYDGECLLLTIITELTVGVHFWLTLVVIFG